MSRIERKIENADTSKPKKGKVVKIKKVSQPNPNISATDKPRKMEFSKKWLIACMSITCVFTIASYVFAWYDKNAVSEIAVAIIQTLWGTSGVSFGCYCLQNSVRAWTSTKFQNNDTPPENVNPVPENNQMGNPIDIITQTDSNEFQKVDDYDYR